MPWGSALAQGWRIQSWGSQPNAWLHFAKATCGSLATTTGSLWLLFTSITPCRDSWELSPQSFAKPLSTFRQVLLSTQASSFSVFLLYYVDGPNLSLAGRNPSCFKGEWREWLAVVGLSLKGCILRGLWTIHRNHFSLCIQNEGSLGRHEFTDEERDGFRQVKLFPSLFSL